MEEQREFIINQQKITKITKEQEAKEEDAAGSDGDSGVEEVGLKCIYCIAKILM